MGRVIIVAVIVLVVLGFLSPNRASRTAVIWNSNKIPTLCSGVSSGAISGTDTALPRYLCLWHTQLCSGEFTAAWAGFRSPRAGDHSLHPTTAALNCLLIPAWVVGSGFSSHLNDEIRSLFAHPQASSRLQLWRLSAWSSYPTWERNSVCS